MLRPRLWAFPQPRPPMLVRALIPDPAAIRTGRVMSMPRLESRSLLATGVPSVSGTVMPGACAACAFAADQLGLFGASTGGFGDVTRDESHG